MWLFLIRGHGQRCLSPGFPWLFAECCLKMSSLLRVLRGGDLLRLTRMQKARFVQRNNESKRWLGFENSLCLCAGCFPFYSEGQQGADDTGITRTHVRTISGVLSYHFYTMISSAWTSFPQSRGCFICHLQNPCSLWQMLMQLRRPAEWHFTADVRIIKARNDKRRETEMESYYKIYNSIGIKCFHYILWVHKNHKTALRRWGFPRCLSV